MASGRAWLILVLIIAASSGLSATTYNVVQTSDSWVADGGCSLREAIQSARDHVQVDACAAPDSTPDVIVLKTPGTYTFDTYAEYVSNRRALEIRSDTLDPTSFIVDLQKNKGFVRSTSGIGSLTLRGFTIRNSDYSAVFVDGISLTLDRMKIDGNVSVDEGAGVRWDSGIYSTLTITSTAFDYNSSGDRGGALSIDGGCPRAITLRDVDFIGNHGTAPPLSSVGGGGALYMRVSRAYPPTTASCIRCRFSGNSLDSASLQARGGSVYLSAEESGEIHFEDVDIESSTALGAMGEDAGAIYGVAFGGRLSLDRVRVHAVAMSRPGAAVELFASFAGVVSLTNAAITEGARDGLAVTVGDPGSRIDVGQATIADQAGTGAALQTLNGGLVRLHNVLLAGNGVDATTDSGVEEIGTCAAMGGDFPGFVDPGGGDYHLTPTSAAVDAGLDSLPTQQALDLDHRSRVAGLHPDCGAYERDALFGDEFEDGPLGTESLLPGVTWSEKYP